MDLINKPMATFNESFTFSRSRNSNSHVLCDSPSAIVDGNNIIGTKSLPLMEGTITGKETSYIKWQTQLNEDVTRLTSTEDGNVFAASTKDQTLSLIRGCDGRVLVSRSIKPKATDGDSKLLTSGITFVRNTGVSNINDVLIVPYLVQSKESQENKNAVEALIVYGIDGHTFNSECDDVKKSALIQISTNTIRIELSSKMIEVAWVDSCLISKNVIRFIIADNHGNVSLYDHDIVTKKEPIAINDCLELSIRNENDEMLNSHDIWSFETATKLCEMDCRNNGDIFLILVAKSRSGSIKICWFDFMTLEKLCTNEIIKVEKGNETPRIQCIKPVKSPDNSVAVGIGIQTESNRTLEIKIVQCAVLRENDNISTGKRLISNPQTIFKIQVNSQDKLLHQSNRLISELHPNDEFYSFSYRLDSGTDIQNWDFEAGEHEVIGQIKLLLSSGMMEEASKAILELPGSKIFSDFGSVHSSEITLWKFKHMLTKTKLLSKDVKHQLKDIFGSLAMNAVSGGQQGKQSLIRASEALRDWPILNQQCGPQIRDFRMIMTAMHMNIINAIKIFDHCNLLKCEAGRLEAKIECLKCVEEVLQIGKEGIVVGRNLGELDNIADLFSFLIRIGAFTTVEQVRKYDAGRSIGSNQILSAISRIPVSIHPRTYCNWLQEVAIPSLVFNNESIYEFLSWCCYAADFFDQDNSFGIDASILLLETTSKAIINSSVDKYVLFTSHFATGRGVENLKSTNYNEHSIDMKLKHARLLRFARKLGLSESQFLLSSFTKVGGAHFIAKELIRTSFESCRSQCIAVSSLKGNIQKFCNDAGINFDDAVLKYAEELCHSHNKSFSFKEASGLTSLCSDAEKRCQVALKILRTLQLFNNEKNDFKSFASNAIEWAQQETTKSELEEVTRLLVIDEIVRRYCGSKASKLFRVSDPIHSYRLLSHVIRYIDVPSQLEDVMFLCDSFTHLSKADAGLQILQKIVVAPEISHVDNDETPWKCRKEHIEAIILSLLNVDAKMTLHLALKLCMFCSEIICHLQEQIKDQKCINHTEKRNQYFACCSAVISSEATIANFFNQLFDKNDVELEQLQIYSRQFDRLKTLFMEFGLVISLADLCDQQKYKIITTKIIKSSLQSWMKIDDDGLDQSSNLKLALDRAMKGAAILCNGDLNILDLVWCEALGSITKSLVRSNNEDTGLKIIEVSEIWNETQNKYAYDALVMIAIELCSKLQSSVASSLNSSRSSMRRILMARSLVQEHLIINCSEMLLPSAIFLHNTTDITYQLIKRADCGVGEEMEKFMSEIIENSQAVKSLLFERSSKPTNCSKPVQIDSLHPSWYIGDGLLLPPTETVEHCMSLFRELLIITSLIQGRVNQSSINRLLEFLHSRGAYAISSRIFMYTLSVIQDHPKINLQMYSQSRIHGFENEINFCLAERGLGSSGSGNTCGRVDSQLAAYHLLSLPLKVGFKVFERCLPSALSGRDFGRLVTLANIGLQAAGVKSIHENEEVLSSFTWHRQSTFISQCKSLFTRAYYWKILQFLRVPFDPNSFEEFPEGNDKKSLVNTSYSKKLCVILQSIINQASTLLKKTYLVTDIIIEFSQTFRLNPTFAIQAHIEYLLKWPKSNGILACNYTRQHKAYISKTDESIEILLDLLPTQVDRALVLRKCIIDLEQVAESGRDFDHYSFILSLYHNELCELKKESSAESKVYIQDMEGINRRLDALAILSSFFEGKPYGDRPLIQKCFIPLTRSAKDITWCGVLGHREYNDTEKDVIFDPLLPLSHCLKDETAVSALAPLCASLGLPTGFIHARSLIERLEEARNSKTSFPSLTSLVLPTIKRLKNPKDGTCLAEWCAIFYPHDSYERLQCLELAHNLAIRSSSQAEIMRRKNTDDADSYFAKQERVALDVLKRITGSKSIAEDKVIVTDCLKKCFGNTCGLDRLLSQVLKTVKEVKLKDFTPEKLVENLLVQGSLLASEALLNRKIGIHEEDFFQLSCSISNACLSLEEKYSHINVQLISKSFVQQLLAHGDESLKCSLDNSDLNSSSFNKIGLERNNDVLHHEDTDEDETKELVLNMNVITASQWSNDLSPSDNHGISDEEPSSLNEAKNGREASEYLSARVGLRVAFIVSGGIDERDKECQVRNLLKLIFAKSYGRCALTNLPTNTFYSDREKLNGTTKLSGNGLTFAMRYRALRAVSAMCDKETIQSIIEEERLVNRHTCTFSQCCFGLLIAKEIEAMRLSLPHSDLEQLSVMHHPSYARTLWKHFNHNCCNSYKGRFFVLLLELILMEKETQIDMQILKTILSQTLNNQLPRTMLLACECLAGTRNLKHILNADKEIELLILGLTKKLTSSILREINESTETVDIESVVSTVYRLGTTVLTFVENGLMSDEVKLFVKMLCEIGDSDKNHEIALDIYKIAFSISLKLRQDMMNETFTIILSSKNGCNAFRSTFGDNNNNSNTPDHLESPNDENYHCLHRVFEVEKRNTIDFASFYKWTITQAKQQL